MHYTLVTGANKGIGLAVVEAILSERRDHGVLLGSRDPALGELARDQLRSKLPDIDGRLEVLPLDVCAPATISAAAERIKLLSSPDSPALYALVNNAGRGDGSVAEVLDVNAHAIKRLCETLAPQMLPGGRIVNVTSAAAPNFVARCDAPRQAFFRGENTTEQELDAFMADCEALPRDGLSAYGMNGGAPYGLSKACANLYTQFAADRWPQLRVNACTPGFIETDLGKAFLGERTPAEAGMKSPADGARVIMHLLFSDDVGSGHYYGSDCQRSPLDRYRAPGSAPFTG